MISGCREATWLGRKFIRYHGTGGFNSRKTRDAWHVNELGKWAEELVKPIR
jgi:hypothetical protein